MNGGCGSHSSTGTDIYCMGTCIIICDATNGIDCPATPVTSGTKFIIMTDTLPPTNEPTLQPSYMPSNAPTNTPSMHHQWYQV